MVLPGPDWKILGTLFLIAGASVAIFSMLVRRWTTRRQWVSLVDWAKERKLKLARREALVHPPEPLRQLSGDLDTQVRIRLDCGPVSILQFDTRSSDQPGARTIWNAIIRQTNGSRSSAPVGLRPANLLPGKSIIDLFRLTPFHSLGNDRFSVLAADGRSAAALVHSSARALLPADVGILMHGQAVLLDFSARPFDPVELDRMMSVMEQVCSMC